MVVLDARVEANLPATENLGDSPDVFHYASGHALDAPAVFTNSDMCKVETRINAQACILRRLIRPGFLGDSDAWRDGVDVRNREAPFAAELSAGVE
jgi:hypothetical protein